MRAPVTQKKLIDWAGERVFRDAELLVDSGRVMEADYKEPMIVGSLLWNNRPFKTSMEVLPDGNVMNRCPCRDNTERGIICAHVIALGLVLVRRAVDPEREAKYRAEERRAKRIAEAEESSYIQRSPEGIPAKLRVSLGEDWTKGFRDGATPMFCDVVYEGQTVPAGEVPRDISLSFKKQDESILFVLEDISEGPVRSELEVGSMDLVNLIELHAGRKIGVRGGDSITVNAAKMQTQVRMDMDEQTGELILCAHTELPFMEDEDPFYLVTGRSGWVLGADNLWPLENLFPGPYQSIYAGQQEIGRTDVLRFIGHELPALAEHARVISQVTPDLFTVEPAVPVFKLVVKGSPASIAGELRALYNGFELVACKPDAREHFGIPDPDDIMRYTVRNPNIEQRALDMLNEAGLIGFVGDALDPVVGEREVLNFLGSHIPSFRRRGWRIEMEGKAQPYFEDMRYVTPVVHIDDHDKGWFDVQFEFEDDDGQSLSHRDIQRALMKGDSYIDVGQKRFLIDADAVSSMMDVFSDCASDESDKAGSFRLSNVYAPFIKSSLDALDGVDVETQAEWRTRASQCNREMKMEAVTLRPELDKILRPYQKEGASWLNFLEKNGFCGLLADEMGLGKTVQTLAWLELQRHRDETRDSPALLVCPTSLVENWIEEGMKFTPSLKMINLTGSDRHERWDQVDECDVVVTSYALLRRDIDKYLQYEFSAAILDEAQHIKNRSTQNAVAAKKIRASTRLVLTGTPVENSVTDLWSIMDFLMPGYLGNPESFRQGYELPIMKAGPTCELAQAKLRRKMQPFLLRRLRKEVAKDLPPKIEKISFCSLTADQRMVYNELLKKSRKKASDMVSKKGFNKSRMEILTMLMRLRQVCCHLDLLKLPDLKPEFPSAKMSQFFELMDEALDGGHRILVFSQFVTMLQILKKELEERKLDFCYLDGSTKDRMTVVKKFNTDRSVPFFLISLKAGGTGLNLVGADMVVHFDPWWNPAVEAQATDRAYRIGQKRTVYNIKMITRGTVEEKVLALQEKKQAIIDATIESDDKMIQSLSWDDIEYLLTL